jgi:hypothetical protein
MKEEYFKPDIEFVEISKKYREEKPVYYCKNCIRETKYGKESLKYGIICFNLHNGICLYCNEKLLKIKE